MRERARGLLVAAGLAVAFGELTPAGQVGTAETHIAAAKAAAGTDHAFMFETLCVQALAGLNQPAAPPAVAAQGRGAQPAGPPARATWHAEPVKVFDNLYFVGQTEYSAWAVTTSAGIIVIDTIFDYSVEDEVVGGLKKLGLDPGADQVRHRQPRPRRSFRRREVPAGPLRHAHHPVGRRLGPAGSQHRHEAQARHGRDRRPEAHARRHDADDVPDAGPHARHDLDDHSR